MTFDVWQGLIFRGNNHYRRREFHNTFVFYGLFQRILAGEDVAAKEYDVPAEQRLLFAETAAGGP